MACKKKVESSIQELNLPYRGAETFQQKPPLVPLEALLRRLFIKGRKVGDIDPLTAQKVATYLQESLKKGFGSDFVGLPFGSPRHELLAQLHYNVAVFSAFKNHSQIREMVTALVDEKGKVRTFSQFKQAALAINEQYNVHWLRAEHQTALQQGQAAAKWQRFVEAANRFPNLRYSAVQDERTRLQHRHWHGIVRPVGDPFWDTHYPPNGWNCRCTVHQTTEPAEGEPSEPPPAAPFRINAGKTGMIVGQAHPYYRKAPRKVATKAKDFAVELLKEQIRSWAEQRLIGKVFLKEDITARFTEESLDRVLQEPHEEKYFQMLVLLDFERLLRQASPTEPPKPGWRYFSVDIHDTPSLISLQEEAEGRATIYNIASALL